MQMNQAIIINNRWKLGKQLGKGSFGAVHVGEHIKTGELVAIKLEAKSSKEKMLKHEYRVYNRVTDEQYQIPHVHWFGEEDDYNVMVMESVGPNLEQLLDKTTDGVFDVLTLCEIGIQMLLQLEHMHRNRYIHRDLKPENMLCGTSGRIKDLICLVDMGLAKKFKNSDGSHIKYRDNKMIGTARYCSISSHQLKELSRRDDLISLGYILIYLHNGCLPWQNIKYPRKCSRKRKLEMIMECKQTTTIEQLCEGLPSLFVDYMTYVTNLEFMEKPKYKYLRDLFWQKIPDKRLQFKYCWSL